MSFSTFFSNPLALKDENLCSELKETKIEIRQEWRFIVDEFSCILKNFSITIWSP